MAKTKVAFVALLSSALTAACSDPFEPCGPGVPNCYCDQWIDNPVVGPCRGNAASCLDAIPICLSWVRRSS